MVCTWHHHGLTTFWGIRAHLHEYTFPVPTVPDWCRGTWCSIIRRRSRWINAQKRKPPLRLKKVALEKSVRSICAFFALCFLLFASKAWIQTRQQSNILRIKYTINTYVYERANISMEIYHEVTIWKIIRSSSKTRSSYIQEIKISWVTHFKITA